jgi:hemerythrin-like metal-binding protein
MSKNTNILLFALFTGTLLAAIILTFIMLGIRHPIPWFVTSTLLAVPLLLRWKEQHHFVIWKDEYSVGVESLDNDHKKLLNLINQLQASIHYKTGEKFEKETLKEIVAYTKYHFEREEKLLEDAGYLSLEAHKKTHREMINKIDDFMQDYDNRGHKALEIVANFLKSWLIKHINGTDQAYTATLKKKGIK